MGVMKPDDETPDHVARSIDPPRNFTIATEDRVRALAVGVPAYAERKRRIEDMERRFVAKLLAVHATATKRGDDAEAALDRAAAAFDLTRMNALVAAHNRYYPIEANLPIDPESGGPLLRGAPFRPEEPFTGARLAEAARTKLENPR